jgi:hypothetical protein
VKRINVRFLLLTVLVIAIVVGGIFGYRYWVTRPSYLYSSAESYYVRGTQAYYFPPDEGTARGADKDSARAAYERADQHLRALLAQDQDNAKALLLRSKVLGQLFSMQLEEDQAKNPGKGASPEAQVLEQERLNSLHEASRLDPGCVEAHRTLMRLPLALVAVLGENQIRKGADFATRLLEWAADPNSNPWDAYTQDLIDAHFILAWKALRDPEQTPQPDLALEHLNASKDLQKKEGENPPLPRWRAVALEAQALALQAGLLGTSGSDSAEKRNKARKALANEMPKWLKRAAEELNQQDSGPVAKGRYTVSHLAMKNYRSYTDLPGLLNFLTIAVRTAPDGKEAMKRAVLAINVCKKLVNYPGPIQAKSEGDRKWVAAEVVTRAALVPERALGVKKSGAVNPLQDENLKKLRQEVAGLATIAEKEKLRLRPEVYLALALNERVLARAGDDADKRLGAMVSLAEKGLESLQEQRKQTDPGKQAVLDHLRQVELDLRAQAAWALLAQHKPAQAEPHLKVLRAARGGPVFLLEGESAVREGRLEQAVTALEQVANFPDLSNNLTANVLLAHAQLALGNYVQALKALSKVEKHLKSKVELTEEQQRVINQFLGSRKRVYVEEARCYLALASTAANPEVRKKLLQDVAEIVAKELSGQAEEQMVRLLLIDYYIRRAGLGQADAKKDLAQARKILDEAQKADQKEAAGNPEKENVNLAWREVQIRLLEEAGNRKVVVVPRVFADLAATNSFFGKPLDAARQAAGLGWQYQKVDDYLQDYIAKHKNNLNASLLEVRWLILQGNLVKADKVLEELQDSTLDETTKRRLMFSRIELARRRGDDKMVDDLYKKLPKSGKDDLESDILSILYDADIRSKKGGIEQRLKTALSKHEESGVLNFWRGELANREGDHRQAASSFARAMEFTQYRNMAAVGLRVSLLNLRLSQSPLEANKLAAELLLQHPTNPALLQDYAETALLLDHIEGSEGMIAAIARLEQVLESQQGAPSALTRGFLRAEAWNKAGRADLARDAALAALKVDPQHQPSLSLAAELSLSLEEWADTLKLAEALGALKGAKAEAQSITARALIGEGKLTEARKVYERMATEFPKSAVGFVGVSKILETKGDYAGALAWLDRWRDRPAYDPGYLVEKVRLLTKAGRAGEATEFAGKQLQAWIAGVQKRFADLPEAKKTDENLAEVIMGLQLTAYTKTAAGFLRARAYEQAEEWLDRALKMEEKVPAKARKGALLSARELLAQCYLDHAHVSGWPFLRSLYNHKAINAYLDIYEQSGRDAGNNLAWLLAQEGEGKRALEVAEWMRLGRYSKKPISGDRLHPPWVDTLALVLREDKQYARAEKLLDEAVQLKINLPKILLLKARNYAAQNLRLKARDFYGMAAYQATRRAEAALDPSRRLEWQDLASIARREQNDIAAP